MSRQVRRFAALLALCTLAFAQLAVSAYACPMESPPRVEAAEASPCDEMANPNLCDRHCDYGASTVQNAALDLLPPLVAVALPWRLLAVEASPVPLVRLRATLPAPSPPPLVLFGTLRI